jgi:hypothetical protein
MPRPLQGDQKKKDVTLTLDQGIYAAAKVHAKKRRMSVSSLVDKLLEDEIEASKKPTLHPGSHPAQGAEGESTGSTPSYRRVPRQDGIALIAKELSSTPSEFVRVPFKR